MTAIASTAVRDTNRTGFEPLPRNLAEPVAAAVNCRQGGIAVRALSGSDAGYVKPGIAALNLEVLGRFEESFDNTLGANGGLATDFPAGRSTVKIQTGGEWLANSAGADIIAQANVGGVCFVADDQTVALTNLGNTRSPAGIVLQVDSTLGVLVLMGPAISASLLRLATSGASQTQTGTGTLVLGTLAVAANITATSRIFITMKDPGSGVLTTAIGFDVPVANRVVGLATGIGAFTVNMIDNAKATLTSAVSTFDWLVIG
jgi:hypothetical protein